MLPRFLLLARLALLAGATPILLAEGTLTLATPTFVAAGAALDLQVQATGTAPGSGITWTVSLLSDLPDAVSPGPPTPILSGVGPRIPFVAPFLSRPGVVAITARAGDATVTRQIHIAAARTGVPGPPAPIPPRAPEVTLTLAPTPAEVFSGSPVALEATCTGAPLHMRPYWRIARLPLAPFNPPVVVALRFGPKISLTAPEVSQPTLFQITATLQDALVGRTLRVLPATPRPDVPPGSGSQVPPSVSSASGTSEEPDAAPLKRPRLGAPEPPPPPPPPRRTNLDTLPSVLHKHIHSFDKVTTSGQASRALRYLARAHAEELTLTNPGPAMDLQGRIASNPSLKRIRLRQMTGLSGSHIVEALAACPGLTHLSLDATCAVRPDELAAIGRAHPRLTHLEAQDHQASTAALLNGFKGLVALDLHGDGPGLDLRGLVHLQRLTQKGTSYSRGVIEGAHLPASLQALELVGCALGRSPLPAGIHDLRLTHGSGLRVLAGLTRLRTLVLNHTGPEPRPFRLQDVARANPDLTHLDTDLAVENIDIDSLPAGMTHLRCTGSALTAPLNFSRFHSLTRLEILDAACFKADLLPASLRSLLLTKCTNVDWSPLAALPLTQLTLIAPKHFTFAGLNPALTDLTVENAEGATILRMQKALPKLIQLKTLKFTFRKGSLDLPSDGFLEHKTLERVELRRFKGSETRIWTRPEALGSGSDRDAPDGPAHPDGPELLGPGAEGKEPV